MKLESTSQNPAGRVVEGLAVGLSIAYGEDSAACGFTEEEMNRSVVRLAEGLLAAGAKLVFGHDWRPNGVMAAVARLAVRYERPSGSDAVSVPGACRITNLVPWDGRADLPDDLRRDLEARGILRIEEVPLPDELAKQQRAWGKPALRAAALCLLRRRLADLCQARICLGGKFQKYEGYWPGIVEEAWTSTARDQPVFLSGILGGAARRLLDAVRNGAWNNLLSPPSEELRRGLEKLREFPAVPLPDFSEVRFGMEWNRLQARSGLDPEDWQRLTDATDIEVVTALVLKGLQRIEGR